MNRKNFFAGIAIVWTQIIFAQSIHRYLYVATPGIRNYLEYGGHGLLVFDIDDHHSFVKRIPTSGLDSTLVPDNVKGIEVSIATQCAYITTIHTIECIDLITEKSKWEKTLPKGCDRLSISPDGKTLYVPSFEKEDWYILDAVTGNIKQTISPDIKSHNTIFGMNGNEVYLEGLKSPNVLAINPNVPAKTRIIGPFSNVVRPFTINGSQTKVFVNCNDLLGFEIGDIRTGKKLATYNVKGYNQGPVKRHGCPSHGIALRPDEKEVWISDAFNQMIHVFSLDGIRATQVKSIPVREQPGWITFTQTGDYGYPSTGEVIDPKTKSIVTTLQDENGHNVMSEKMLEIDFNNGRVVSMGDQFGLGRKK